MRVRTLAAAIPYVAVLIGIYEMGNVWAAMGLYHLGAVIFLFLHRSGPGWRSLVQGWLPSFGWPLTAMGALGGPALFMLFPRAGLPSGSLATSLSGLGLTGETFLLFFVIYVTVTPAIEELLWRGKLGSRSRGPAASDVLFAGYHVLVLVKFLSTPWVGAAFLVLLATAWLWRQAARRSGGLLVPFVSHLVADVSLMLAVHSLL